jgi:hypothetical protein
VLPFITGAHLNLLLEDHYLRLPLTTSQLVPGRYAQGRRAFERRCDHLWWEALFPQTLETEDHCEQDFKGNSEGEGSSPVRNIRLVLTGEPLFIFILNIITVLSFTQRQAILFDNQDGDVTMVDGDDNVGNDSDWEDEVHDGLHQLPPGEEGFLQSHAGGEAVLQAVMDGITLS